MLRMPFEPLKHRFFDLTQPPFWGGQEEENEFTVPGYHWKHRFLDLTKIEYWAFQEVEYDL